MLSILNLPPEILSRVVRDVALSGELFSLRLSNSHLLEVISGQPQLLLEDLCRQYGVGHRIMELYLSAKMSSHQHLSIITFGNFLHKTAVLGSDVDRAISNPEHTSGSGTQFGSREPFVLFAVFSHELNSSLQAAHSTMSGVLAPSSDGGSSYSMQFSQTFLRFLHDEVSLEDLEAIISAVNVCTLKLWSSVFMFRPKDSTVSGFGSLSGASFNTDQSILTEHVIWKGPSWVFQILNKYGPVESGMMRKAGGGAGAEDILVKEGLWRGSREEGARLAANGVARLLWKERQRKIEARVSVTPVDKMAITDLRVNASVWRGSSGDL